jgi:hypothetical protein
MSFSRTGLPSLPVPSGSVVRSMSSVPGERVGHDQRRRGQEVHLTSGCTRPSKLRLPESTEQAVISPALTASEISGFNGPELPMQVVQP